MTSRSWIDLARSFCAHLRALIPAAQATFLIFGDDVQIIGTPATWQFFDADNDNEARS